MEPECLLLLSRVPVLNHITLVQAIPSSLFRNFFNILHPCHPGGLVFLGFPTKILLSHACHMSRASHLV